MGSIRPPRLPKALAKHQRPKPAAPQRGRLRHLALALQVHGPEDALRHHVQLHAPRDGFPRFSFSFKGKGVWGDFRFLGGFEWWRRLPDDFLRHLGTIFRDLRGFRWGGEVELGRAKAPPKAGGVE